MAQKPFTVAMTHGELTALTKDEAIRLGAEHAKPGSPFAVESPRGALSFYKRGDGGPVAYPISAKAASWLTWTS